MSRGRSIVVAGTVLGVAGASVAALLAVGSQTTSSRLKSEIAALKRSENASRPTSAAPSAPPLCRALTVSKRGAVSDGSLNELSGLVASRRTPGLFWGEEDSGAPPVISAIRENGKVVGKWTVAGAQNTDWEDLAAGPGRGGPVIYAADIGDNDAVRDSIDIYRVSEPTAPAGGGTTLPSRRLRLTYPDGAHDAETLLVDPTRGTLVIITKGLGGGTAYAISNPPFGGSATLRKITGIAIPLATAGDVSRDGKTIAVRGYFSLSIWTRRGNEPITETLKRTPCRSPTGLDDGQGEAIALSAGGTTAWTTAEGSHPQIRRLTAAKRRATTD